MSLTLYDYQTELIGGAKSHLVAGIGRILLQSPTGSGKTVLIAHMLKTAKQRGYTAWFVVHRRELVKQAAATLVDSAGVSLGIVAAGFQQSRNEQIQVCLINTLANRHHLLKPPDMIVWDECFVAGTMVDGHPIESLRVGDVVTAWNEKTSTLCVRRVAGLLRRPAPERLYRIRTGGHVVICTGNHPFLSQPARFATKAYQWIPVQSLRKGDFVYGVCDMWRTDEQEQASPMQKLLCAGSGGKKQADRSATDARAESNARSGREIQDGCDAEAHRTQAVRSWWERAKLAAASRIVGFALAGIYAGIRRADWLMAWRERLVEPLQDRPGERSVEAGNRGRREIPQHAESQIGGPEERGVLEITGVDSIEILERGSDGEYERVCPDGLVYNLEVEDAHTYTANGFVVHNCHHIAAGSWARIQSLFPNAVHIGATATPQRLDGTGLGLHFDVLVTGPSVSWLIENKFLSPYKLYAPAGADLSFVHTVAGDYNKKELSEAMQQSPVVGDALKHYQKYAMGKRAVVFMWSIEASKEIAARFNDAGIPAAHIDGKTPDNERDDLISRFRDGRILMLSNVDIISEGFDLPAIEAAFLLRPTQSLSLYLQQVGRALRTFPGKTEAQIFDHAGNCRLHGLPDDERIWSLEGRKKRKGDSTCPVKQCQKCYAMNAASVMVCKYCGFAWQIQSRDIDQGDGELGEVDKEAMRAKRKAEERACRTMEELVALGERRGYLNPSGWARHMMKWGGRSQQVSTLPEGADLEYRA